jgi:hypothetical protein
MNKKVIIIGGGTFSHVRCHMALAAPAFGYTAKVLFDLCKDRFHKMDVELVLTKMADPKSDIITSDDLLEYVKKLVTDNTVKVVFFNAAVCDFNGQIDDIQSSKKSERLDSSQSHKMLLTPQEKIIGLIRKHRKDIFLVGFKTTNNAQPAEQFEKGLRLLKGVSANLVLANDVANGSNLIVTPEEGVYDDVSNPPHASYSRYICLRNLVDMAYYRSHLSFTRSTVVDGSPIPWDDDRVYPVLREVVNWCISRNAYKVFNGVTTGHFAAKLAPTVFLTSIRKTNFNDIYDNGMVLVRTDGDDAVISYGAKPSVGGQSQRIIFNTFTDTDCIVHFHCPLKADHADDIPVVSQREYECGSHECGQNTANGLKQFGDIYAVMLDKHGPNIVFNSKVSSQQIIDFINRNFDLDKSTSGFQQVYLK